MTPPARVPMAGGVIVAGPGWRWVMFVTPVVVAVLLPFIIRIIPSDSRAPSMRNFDIVGATAITAAMLLLVHTVLSVPEYGIASPRIAVEFAAALSLTALFFLRERWASQPLVPLSTFRIPGLVAANIVGLVSFAGMLGMFYFLTLYMQNTLGYSTIAAGAAYLPMTLTVGVSATASSVMIRMIGTRITMIIGSALAASGMFWLSRVSVDGTYLLDILPGTILFALGIGPVFVGVTSSANAGANEDRAGLVAALLTSVQQIGAAIGIATLSVVASNRFAEGLADHMGPTEAQTMGYRRAFFVGGLIIVAAAISALATRNIHESNGPMA